MTDDLTPYKRPPSTRKVHRGLQAQYLKELTDIRLCREALLDLRRQERVFTLELRIMQLTRGYAKDPSYLEKLKAREALRPDIHTRDNELFDKNKALRSLKTAMKKAEQAHLETRLALKTPALRAAFGELTMLRSDAAQRDREYKDAYAVYQEAQRALDDTNRRKNIAQRAFDQAVADHHSHMKGRVRKKVKKVAAKSTEVQP